MLGTYYHSASLLAPRDITWRQSLQGEQQVRPSEWALVQHDGCSYEKRKRGQTQRERKRHVKMQGEDGCAHPVEVRVGPTWPLKAQPCWHLGLGLVGGR